jgi:hypothetical protein
MKIWAKTAAFREGKFLVVRRDGTVPHWPHFVLGARDKFAPTALRAYAKAAREDGFLDAEYIDSLLELADDFDRYRFVHGDGDPDAPPHRHDDYAVLAAMRGIDTPITVKIDRGNEPKAS